MKYLICVAVSALLAVNLYGQQSIGGSPLSPTIDAISNQEFEYIEFNALDLEQIEQEDLERASLGQLELFSRYIETGINLEDHGTWETLSNGDRIWRLKVTARDAKALNFIYNDFHLAENCVFYISASDDSMTLGGYTSNNNKPSGIFATGNILGESVVLELFEPLSSYGESIISINQIGYVYRDVFVEIDGQLRGSDQCQVDVACSEADDWQDEQKGVVRILLTSNQGQGWCSGSLVNNTSLDCAPYILTAWHCGVNSTANQYNSYIYYFNYQAASCDSNNQSGTQSITGSTRIAYSDDGGGNSGSDFLLTEINQDLPTNIDAYYNGWNANNTTSSGGVSIHHPAGDFKKISTYTSNLQSTTWGGVPNTHWRVNWSATANGHGVTEGGSSGSPIFNNSGLIIGQLTGGSSFCDTPNNPDAYGKMSYNWESNGNQDYQELKNYLDPINSGVLTLNGTYAPCNDPTLFGCTDPDALNYDPIAEEDDGSCQYPCLESTVNINLTLDCFGSETSWQLINSASEVVYSVDENTYPGAEGNAQAGGSEDMLTLCIPADCYTLILSDTYGDGVFGSQWNSCSVDGDLVITDVENTVLAAMGDPDFGFEISYEFCLTEIDQDDDGFLISEGDCNDLNPDVNPNATEICDGIDNNCNGFVDENFVTNEYFIDEDEDGFGNALISVLSCFQPDGYVSNDDDCDDTNGDVHPNAGEECDGIDNNCNNQVDEGFTQLVWYLDSDNDSYGNPNSTILSCFQPDGYADNGDDCNDVNVNVNPGSTEICNNADDDCSGEIDDNIATQTYYIDQDNDGFGFAETFVVDCEAPDGYVDNADDCDDSNSNINPDGTEILDDGIDQDCNGSDLVTGLEELDGFQFDMYPNPAVSELMLSVPHTDHLTVEIYDASGRLVWNDILSGSTVYAIDLNAMADGNYTVKVQTEELISVQNLMITKQ